MINEPPATLDLLGYWWLPEHADHRVPGRLTWSSDGGGRLELLGELRPLVIKDNVLPDGSVQQGREHRTKLENQFPVIHGIRQIHGREEAYTLLRSFSLSGIGLNGLAEGPESVAVNGVLVGAWYLDLDDLEADRARFEIRHLGAWVDTSGVTVSHPAWDEGPQAPDVLISAKRPSPYVASNERGEVRFVYSLIVTREDGRAYGVALATGDDSIRSFNDHVDVAMDVRALVTIAAGRSADIEKVVVQHPNFPALNLSGEQIGNLRDDIVYYNRWAHRTRDEGSVRRHELLFTLEQFGGVDAVARWLSVATEYRTELRRVMATRYRADTMFLEDKIMNICAALDSLDAVRRKPKDPFARRIRACVEFAGELFETLLAEDVAMWIKKVTAARNSVAHHNLQFRADGTAGEGLLAEQLYWLFVLCMFRLCEVAPEAFEAISEHRDWRWLQERAGEL